jgi:hypothetical protein
MEVRERQAGDLDELRRRARDERHALRRDRWRAVVLALEGNDAPAVASMLGRARRSVQDWCYAYRDGGVEAVQPKPRPGRSPSWRAAGKTSCGRGWTPAPGPATASARCAAGTW